MTTTPAPGADALDRKARCRPAPYYLDKVAEGAEDYYSGEGEAAGYWLGEAARELGLEGHVEPDQPPAKPFTPVRFR